MQAAIADQKMPGITRHTRHTNRGHSYHHALNVQLISSDTLPKFQTNPGKHFELRRFSPAIEALEALTFRLNPSESRLAQEEIASAVVLINAVYLYVVALAFNITRESKGIHTVFALPHFLGIYAIAPF